VDFARNSHPGVFQEDFAGTADLAGGETPDKVETQQNDGSSASAERASGTVPSVDGSGFYPMSGRFLRTQQRVFVSL
jgi:hypothetical protein